MSADPKKPAPQDSVLKYMIEHHMELTRENYVALNWGEGHELVGEDCADLPEELWGEEEAE